MTKIKYFFFVLIFSFISRHTISYCLAREREETEK